MRWNSISDDVLRAYAAGLVHDLGKVWAQVPGRGTEPSRYNCATPERHATRFDDCASCKVEYRYAHAPMGANLVEAELPQFGFLAEIAARHHAKDPGAYGDLLRWVVLGDHLSAGERDERHDGGSGQPVPALLHPLAQTRLHIGPGVLHSGLLFDVLEEPAASDSARSRYAGALESLRNALRDAGNRSGKDLLALCDHLTGAIYTATMAIPSAFQSAVADIPLATHLHLAGAFAAALAADGSPAGSWEDARLGLVTGDLSGIQEFIHDTGSRRAARALRARSFYVQLLSLVAARWVAIECGVPPGNAFSVVGGRFLVAVPAGAIGKLPELQYRLDRILWEAHGPTLAIGMAGVVVTGRELADFRSVHERLGEQLSVRKRQRCAGLAQDRTLFQPQPVVPAGRACRTCGREPIDGRMLEDDGEQVSLCPVCYSLEELGRRLLDASVLTLTEAETPDGGYGWTRVMARLGHRVELMERAPRGPTRGAVVALDEDALHETPSARYIPTARHVPRLGDQVMDFATLAAQGTGRPAIATLKADVDDLGQFLQQYFQQRPSSPSRFLSVSLALSLFFEAFLPRLAEREFPNIYIIFSGGDDVALAGPLDDVLRFALRLRDEFRRWTGNNGSLHFSAGISAAQAHRPVQAGIEESEQFLNQAKSYESNGRTKNAATILGVVMPWTEVARTVDWADRLAELTGRTGEVQGLARNALQHLQLLEKASPTVYGPLHWRSYYQLNRVGRQYPGAEALLMDLRRQAFAVDGAGGRAVALAARLAELRTAPKGAS